MFFDDLPVGFAFETEARALPESEIIAFAFGAKWARSGKRGLAGSLAKGAPCACMASQRPPRPRDESRRKCRRVRCCARSWRSCWKRFMGNDEWRISPYRFSAMSEFSSVFATSTIAASAGVSASFAASAGDFS